MKKTIHKKRLGLLFFFSLVITICSSASAQAQSLEVKLTVKNGTGDDPMIVAWLENDSGEFIRTLQFFSKDKKYYKEMKMWRFKRRGKEKKSDIDAIVGPTISWKKSKKFTTKIQQGDINILDGSYVIRIEQNKDKGKHYKSFKLPITKDFKPGTSKGKGYIKEITTKIISE